MQYHSRTEPWLLFLGDLLVFFVALWVTLLVRYLDVPDRGTFNAHFVPFAYLSVAWVLVFFIAGLYDKHTAFVKRRLPGMIFNAQIINIGLAALFFFSIPSFGITPKTNLLIYLIVSTLLLIMWRLVLFNVIAPRSPQKALLIGEGPEIEELVREVNGNTRYAFEFVRILESDVLTSQDVAERLRQLIEKEHISVIVADALSERMRPLAPFFFESAFSDRHIRFVDLATLYEDIFDRVPLSLLRYDWFLAHATNSAHPLYDIVKRAIDVAGALACGAVLALITPFVWLAMRLEDQGPLFLEQERLGIYGSRIRVFKFRTMSSNENGVWIGESGNVVTRLGAFLRKTSLDELPQVINILRGDMSLIGPRNDLSGLAVRLAEAIPFYTARTSIKPGITGWAQTHQHYSPGNISPQSVEETKMRLSYDLYYIKHRSLLLDVSIALRTVKTLLARFGINLRVGLFRA
jgi:lipopolysaccharide/colanic/teichoic acid biosynthesis glycosyltransferase